MRRLIPLVVVAVVFFGAGWAVANGPWAPGAPGAFRLSIDVPTGDTTITCEGCEFLTWVDGHLADRQPVFTFTCSDGPCWTVVGARTVTPAPRLIARPHE